MKDRAVLQRPKEGWGKGEPNWLIHRKDGTIEHVEPAVRTMKPGDPGWEGLTQLQQEWCTLNHEQNEGGG